METRTKLAWCSAILLLALVTAWFFGWFGGDPAIAKLQELGDQMSDDLPADQRDQLRNQFRQQMQSLSDEQRRAFFDANRERWQSRQQQRMDEFFKLPKNEQRKRLDEAIGRMNRPRGNDRPRGDSGLAGRGSSGRAGQTESQREERSKRRLDGSTPKMRAQFAEYRRLLTERAQQLGVSISGWGRGA